MDGCDELITEMLNCIVGTVDSEDPPLNISRLTLEQNKTLRVIEKNLVKKCLEMFAEIAEKKDDYKTFYKQFGNCLKLGIHEDPTKRTKIAVLLGSQSGDEQVSMKEYIDHMKKGQSGIYYITDENITVVSSSRVIKKNLAKQCLEMFAGIAEKTDDYKKFYKQIDKCLKLDIHEDSTDRAKIVELLWFNTSKLGDEQISLKQYIDRMKEGQNDIYYITGESIAVVSSSCVIRKNLVKQCLEMFAEIAEENDDFKKFYKQSAKCLKLGIP